MRRAQLSILEACRKYNPKLKLVYTSTRQIYGKPDFLPVDERHLLLGGGLITAANVLLQLKPPAKV